MPDCHSLLFPALNLGPILAGWTLVQLTPQGVVKVGTIVIHGNEKPDVS